jgi:hypothetical protein
VALVAMAFDHLVGDDPGLEDPVAFAVSAVLTLVTAAGIFGVLIPRVKRGEGSARNELRCAAWSSAHSRPFRASD